MTTRWASLRDEESEGSLAASPDPVVPELSCAPCGAAGVDPGGRNGRVVTFLHPM
jgi:hypothetical protein